MSGTRIELFIGPRRLRTRPVTFLWHPGTHILTVKLHESVLNRDGQEQRILKPSLKGGPQTGTWVLDAEWGHDHFLRYQIRGNEDLCPDVDLVDIKGFRFRRFSKPGPLPVSVGLDADLQPDMSIELMGERAALDDE